MSNINKEYLNRYKKAEKAPNETEEYQEKELNSSEKAEKKPKVTEEYRKKVLHRFKKTRKELDRTVEDYITKEFTRNLIGAEFAEEYADFEGLFRENNSESDDNAELEVELEKIFSDELSELNFDCLVLELGQYIRKTNRKTERFTYFEAYNKYGITSILAKPDMVKEVLIKELNLNDSDYKKIIEQIKLCSSFVSTFGETEVYEQSWLEDYYVNRDDFFRNSDADAIMSCPDPKLVYTIAGYAILAYMMFTYRRSTNKILALNIVTDKESVDILQNLIQRCFVNCGYNDSIGIITFNVKTKAEIYYPNCEGRCVVIDAMSDQTNDTLISKLSKYFLYIRETARKVEYPYLFLPIILSSIELGNEFFSIKAKKLSEKTEQWEKVYEAIHRFYKNPIDIKSARIKDKTTNEIYYVKDVLADFNTIYENNRNKFFVPYSNFPVYKYGMNVLLNSCCHLACLNIEMPAEPFSLYSTEKSHEIRQSVNKHLPICSGKKGDKEDDNINLALKVEISPIMKVVDKINDSIKYRLEDDNFEKPDSYSEDEDIGFLHSTKNFSEKYFCFNQYYIESLLADLKLEGKYSADYFIDDCDFSGLLVRDKSEGRKKIKIRFDNGCYRLYALKVHDETGLLYTPDEIQSIISDIENEEASKIPIT